MEFLKITLVQVGVLQRHLYVNASLVLSNLGLFVFLNVEMESYLLKRNAMMGRKEGAILIAQAVQRILIVQEGTKQAPQFALKQHLQILHSFQVRFQLLKA